MQINRYNFLRWDDLEAAASLAADLPTGYIIDSSRCDAKPLLVANEAMRFYINTLAGLSFIPNSSTDKLLLIRAATNAVVNADIAPLNVDTFDLDRKTVYAEVVIDNTVTPGDYYFQIKRGSTIKLQSNLIQVPAGELYKRSTAVVKFRHDRSFYGVNYQNLADFYQQFRLALNQIDEQFEGDREVYTEATTGKQRTFNNTMKKTAKVETYYFDKFAHEAAAIMFDHDEVYINLKRYTPKGTYKNNWDSRSKLFKGEIDLYVEEFGSVNRCIN